MKSSYIFLALIIVGFFLYSRTNSNISKVSSEEGLELHNNEYYTFLDVRTNSEYSAGHIPNSLHIPLNELEGRMSEIESIKDKNIIVYCRSGARSSKATKTLLRNGFNVFNLSGGIMGWEGEMELLKP